MKIVALLALCCAIGSASAAEYFNVSDSSMGEYEGFWETKAGTRGRLTAQVRPLANNQYDGFILLTRSDSPVAVLALKPATAEAGKIQFVAEAISADGGGGDLLAHAEAKCELSDGKLKGTLSGELGEGNFEGARNENEPPSLGAKPPKEAVIVFDGKLNDEIKNRNWPVTKEGFLQAGKGNLVVPQKLKNFKLHLEFRTPYMPIELGQARGNSGVYLQSKYEVQVLDSFGLYPLRDNDCAGIYSVQAPRMNACRPPMAWQTYDITYREQGKGGLPTIAVVHNGVTVIAEAVVAKSQVERGTGGGERDGGFLMLQDHGNAVQFRNIWAEPLP